MKRDCRYKGQKITIGVISCTVSSIFSRLNTHSWPHVYKYIYVRITNETLTQVSFVVLYDMTVPKGVDDCIRVLVPRERAMQSAGVPNIDRLKKKSFS